MSINSSSALKHKHRNKFIIICLLMFVILAGQLSVVAFDVTSISNIEVELSNEEHHDDSILSSLSVLKTACYYFSGSLTTPTLNNGQSKYSLRPNTRAPPFSHTNLA